MNNFYRQKVLENFMKVSPEVEEIHNKILNYFEKVTPKNSKISVEAKTAKWFFILNPMLGASPIDMIRNGKIKKLLQWLEDTGA